VWFLLEPTAGSCLPVALNALFSLPPPRAPPRIRFLFLGLNRAFLFGRREKHRAACKTRCAANPPPPLREGTPYSNPGFYTKKSRLSIYLNPGVEKQCQGTGFVGALLLNLEIDKGGVPVMAQEPTSSYPWHFKGKWFPQIRISSWHGLG